MSATQTAKNQEKHIEELRILYDNGSTLFDGYRYVIPLYQRAFAWGDNEIGQLIEDINDCKTDVLHYYLGSLVVSKKPTGELEVIDGQQRLTALYLLLNFLKVSLPKDSLTYECRSNSNFTLQHLSELLDEKKTELRVSDSEKIENSLINGSQCISSKKIDIDSFVKKLKKVRIYRIKVPENTDLNRYFEIMNVRGEQLEQHDILKADLMSELKTTQEQSRFAIIWDACSDMSGYVQMHFDVKDRELLFSYDWNSVPKCETLSDINTHKEKLLNLSMINILKSNKSKIEAMDDEYIDESDNRIRFKSIMGFSHFLLHVLRVFIETENFDNSDSLVGKQLDDKKLLHEFRSVKANATICGKPFDKTLFARKFVFCLLKCRFLFDKYIIKREYKHNAREEDNSDDDGAWSLKELIVSQGRKPYYAITRLKKYIKNTTVEVKAEENLMIQSCLRVSFLSQKVAHWVTTLLKWLYTEANYEDMTGFNEITENIAKEQVKEFLNERNFRRGVETPHIVFNYLDYLLWTKRNESEYEKVDFANFVFEFRNSVEHWYPQNPSDQSFAKWHESDELGKQVDRFGNLCLIQRNINSKFSNLSPHSKYDTYKKSIEKGSLKLRLMSNRTKDDSKWKNTVCEEHEKEMLDLLRKACSSASIPN